MTRILIVGPRGIGAVHARVLRGLGAELCGLVATGVESARASARSLRAELGVEVPAFADVEEGLDRSRPEAVVIASPAGCHRAHLLAALARELPVLCEKPLHWPEHDVGVELAHFREELASRHGARLLLNTTGVHFIEAVLDELEDPDGDLEFEFHTLGRATGEAIAVDLLPHAFALLGQLQPIEERFDELAVDFAPHHFAAGFHQAGRRVRLDLRADPCGTKHLAFSVGGQRFTRRQQGSGVSYRVFLEDARGRQRELEDPFVTRARRFLALCAGRGDWSAARAEALVNQAALVRFLRATPRRQRTTSEEDPCLRA